MDGEPKAEEAAKKEAEVATENAGGHDVQEPAGPDMAAMRRAMAEMIRTGRLNPPCI